MSAPRKVSATTKMEGGATVEGLNGVLKALNRLDKAGKKAVKDETQKIANMLAKQVAAAGNRTGDSRDRLVAGTVRGTRERVPTLAIGKATPRLPSGGRARPSDLMFGMEFGSSGFGSDAVDVRTPRGGAPGWRFPDRTQRLGRGNAGRWIYPTVRQQQQRVVEMWSSALEKVAKEWGKG